MKRKDLIGFILGYGGILLKAIFWCWLFSVVRCMGAIDGCLWSDLIQELPLILIIFMLFAVSIIPDIVLIVILTFSLQSPKIYKTAFVLDITIILSFFMLIYALWG